MSNTICTIGFSKKSLRNFISLLQEAKVTKLIDTRLNNTSQLSGFAKKMDIEYVLELVGIDYSHITEMAPTEKILKGYKNKKITWDQYEEEYNQLIVERNMLSIVEKQIPNETICLLCSEETPHHCHRRLLAEYVQKNSINDIVIKHLV